MKNNNSAENVIELVPLQQPKVKLEAGRYPGRFSDVYLNTTPTRSGGESKELIVSVTLDKQENEKAIVVKHAFNFLPGKRGKSNFKSCMSSFLKREFVDADLASFKPHEIMQKKVICEYKTNKLGNAVVFVNYLPVD